MSQYVGNFAWWSAPNHFPTLVKALLPPARTKRICAFSIQIKLKINQKRCLTETLGSRQVEIKVLQLWESPAG